MTISIKRAKRRTLVIRVNNKGETIVTAPYFLSDKEINKHIESRLEWIEKKSAQLKKANEKCYTFQNFEVFSYFGEVINIEHVAIKKPIIIDAKLLFPINKNQNNVIKSFCIGIFDEVIIKRINAIKDLYNFEYSEVKPTSAQRKWGSFDTKKRMLLNWRVCMLHVQLIDYIIIHEFAHSKEMNHSPKFWNVVESYLPNYKELRKQLKNYSFILSLYR